MSVSKFKRRPSGLDYVDNAFELQKDIMNLASKLSARWARIYQQPIDELVCKQADLVNMAYSITTTTTSNPYCYNNTQKTEWLRNYTRECVNWKCSNTLDYGYAYGYWAGIWYQNNLIQFLVL